MAEETKPKPSPEPDETKTPKKTVNRQTVIIIILIIIILFLTGLYAYSKFKKPQGGNTAETIPTSAVAPSNLAADNSAVADNQNVTPTPAVDNTAISNTANPNPVPTVTKADLYVKKYSFNHDPKTNEEFTVKVDIGNKGGTDAEDFYWEWWPTSSGKACREKVDKIVAGGVESVSCNYTYNNWAESSTKVIVDASDDVDESNENNNVATKDITPTHDIILAPLALPDLYVSDYHFNHDPVMGEAFRVYITIYNKGNATAGASHWVWWATTSGMVACQGDVGSIAAHGGIVVQCNYTYGGWANYTTKVAVDSNNDVVESNEGNNTVTKAVTPIH